ncbi:ABC transporter permease [Methylocapsa polymorpha]|uniref:ABC transporter permease n=1 Tax=Methylocapsa polymorpha TaxID=3080828 RepID=A0ABZ0HLJ8_9HYPH|nr:ABC transporter permease [Methylocapsa sp. RX1]
MGTDRRTLFLLLRLAAQNVGRRRLRTVFLGIAVMISVGVGFSGFVIGSALRDGVATTFSRMGADLVVVPYGTLVNITSILLTVQPTDQELDLSLGEKLRAIPGVGKVAAQRLVRAEAEGRALNLIAYDPATDFTVRPWLPESQRLAAADGALVGERVQIKPGEVLNICGRAMVIAARLGKTGVGPFDESYFVSFYDLDGLIAARRRMSLAAGVAVSGAPAAPIDPLAAAATHRHVGAAGASNCLADLAPDRVSAFLIQLSSGASPEQVKFAIGQIPGIKIVTGNAVFTASRQSLGSLFWGVAIFAGLLLLALLFLVSLLFSAIVQERYREVGLLRAMGARPAQIFSIILIEAGLITGLGGLFGLGFGLSLTFAFARSLGFYFASIGVPFAWPPDWAMWLAALVSVAVAASIGVVGAFIPAWRARRLEPYVMIQTESAR